MSSADFGCVRKLAGQQGLRPEDLPDFGNNVLIKRVVDDITGRVVCAAIARMELMTHLYLDHTWSTPRMRLEAFRLLHDQMRREAREKGIEIVHAELGSRAFTRRLKDLGWDTPQLAQLILKI